MSPSSSKFSDSLMVALGRFILAWSYFEYELGLTFSQLMNCPLQRGLVVYYSLNGYSAHRDLLKAVTAETGFQTPPQALLDILTEADQFATLRNDLVHGEWKQGAHGPVISVFKPRNRMRSYFFDVTEDQMLEWADGVDALTDRLAIFAEQLRTSPHHSQKDPSD